MKIRITGKPITMYGSFEPGVILTDAKYPIPFLQHLVVDCNAAEYLDLDTKVDNDYEVKKSDPSLPLSQPDKVSPRPMSKSRKKKRKLSR